MRDTNESGEGQSTMYVDRNLHNVRFDIVIVMQFYYITLLHNYAQSAMHEIMMPRKDVPILK